MSHVYSQYALEQDLDSCCGLNNKLNGLKYISQYKYVTVCDFTLWQDKNGLEQAVHCALGSDVLLLTGLLLFQLAELSL